MELAQPLSQQQVDSAGRVHQTLKQWCLADTTLAMLATRLPGFSAEECLLKAVAVNSIYGTQLFATLRMAEHIQGILGEPDGAARDADLVERISQLPANPGDRPRLAVSFASKFCHFFVDAETFPIYDEAARDAIKLHLGTRYRVGRARPYVEFCRSLEDLRELAKLNCSSKELDQYLWLTGMFIRWQKEKSKSNPRVNAELKAVFEQPPPAIIGDLRTMLPKHLAVLIRP